MIERFSENLEKPIHSVRHGSNIKLQKETESVSESNCSHSEEHNGRVCDIYEVWISESNTTH